MAEDLYWTDEGQPTDFALGQAVQICQACQPAGSATLGRAARAFHQGLERMATVVRGHPWLFLGEQGPMESWCIEQEGE